MWPYCIITFIVLFGMAEGHSDSKRQKRYLVFTSESQYGAFATVSMPLHPESYVSIAWFFEASYYNVDNVTYFDPLINGVYATSRKERNVVEPERNFGLTRSYMYHLIESMFSKHGYPPRPCLLRAICENVTSHFLHNGLLGDLLHLVLTPSTSMSEDTVEDCFYEAEYYGMEDLCDHYIETCPADPMEYLSANIVQIKG